jgi:hypothetical protein
LLLWFAPARRPVITFLHMCSLRAAVIISLALAVLSGCSPVAKAPAAVENKAATVVSQPQAADAPGTGQAAVVPVPEEYRQLYGSLAGKLESFDKGLDGQCAGANRKIIFAAELLGAHVSEQLFVSAYYRGTLDYLDALKAMGVSGVKIAINYPQLNPDFPDRDKYVDVYKNIVQECRARNIKVLVSSGNYFGPPFTTIKYPLSGLTLEKYRQGKRYTAETILKEFRPDYLTVANEPTTEYMLTGINQSAVEYAETTRFILDRLDRGNTLVGSGTGTWSNMGYIREMVKIGGLDYIDMHIYPLDYLQGAVDAAAIARAANKRMILGELGLYKMRAEEIGDLGKLATQASIFSRDVYSFWEPLDSRFLEVIVKMSKCCGYEFISPFWSTYLFSYINYDGYTKNLGYTQLRQMDNRFAYMNVMTGKLSGWGQTYKRLISDQ